MMVQSKGAEGRTSIRVPMRIAMRIRGDKGVFTAEARDIAEDGVRILSPHKYPNGTKLQISLHRRGSALSVVLEAEVRWARSANAPGIHLLGCRFLHAGESRTQLRELLGYLSNRPKTRRFKAPRRNYHPR